MVEARAAAAAAADAEQAARAAGKDIACSPLLARGVHHGCWVLAGAQWSLAAREGVGSVVLRQHLRAFVPDGALLREIHSSWRACSYAGCC
jgi:hypothetical protein